MLKQFNAPDGDSCKEVSYEYDALNFRTKRTSILEGTVTEYAYGRNGALTYEKFTKNSTVEGSRTYAYLNDQIIGFTDTDGTVESKRYAVTDIQGSVNEIYDESGNLIWKSGYTAFGELAGESVDKLEGVFEFHGMYTGCQIDVETGLTYHWNRWRSEDGANFITKDPARDGINWFGYAGQNPINNVDPNGLAFYGPDGVHSIYDDPYVAPDMNNKNENPTGQNGTVETPKVPETPRGTDTTQPNDLNCDLFAAGYDNEGNLWLFFIIDGVYKSQKATIKKQNEIEIKYGYSNLLCYVTSTLNMYISDGVVNEEFIDHDLGNILDKHLNKDKTSKDYGALDDFNHFSNDIAKGLGLKEYYEYCYKDGKEHILKSEQDFYNLDPTTHPRMKNYGKYGIGIYKKDGIPSHYMLLRRDYHDRINPSMHDDYTFVEARFVFSQKIDIF